MAPSLWERIASALTASALVIERCTGRSIQPISPPTKTLSAWAAENPPMAANTITSAEVRAFMAGLQVLRAVRQIEPGIAFVVFTINADAAFRKRYMAEGARHFLDKVTEFDQLANAVEAAHFDH
jgi:DNA-binding NarL/FixJ family response regulator